MSNTQNDGVERAEMMLAMNMNENGEPLSDVERKGLETIVEQREGSVSVEESATDLMAALLKDEGHTPSQSQADPPGEPDLAALVQAEIAKALGGGLGQPASFADVLSNLDKRDSDAALAMFEWLSATGRFQHVGNLNGGGYLLHYQEPKGSSKQGYTPGATKGGRMVDQAVEQARAAGLTPREVGMCAKCMSAVEKQGDGTVVSDDEHKSDACPAGGAHEFLG